MRGTLVIGWGNSLRGDDGVGPLVAGRTGSGAIACHQLTPELAEPISRAARVIFVDAHAAVPAGQIAIQPIQPIQAALPAGIHRCDPQNLLAWSEQLYGRRPQAILIGIGGQTFEFGEPLSPPARRAARAALRLIRKICAASTKGGILGGLH